MGGKNHAAWCFQQFKKDGCCKATFFDEFAPRDRSILNEIENELS